MKHESGMQRPHSTASRDIGLTMTGHRRDPDSGTGSHLVTRRSPTMAGNWQKRPSAVVQLIGRSISERL
jgi:hypothetical protein